MAKYTSEYKLKIVKEILKENIGVKLAEEKYKINHELLRLWIKKYQEHGTAGLVKNNTKYSGEFKLNVVKYMHENHLSLVETAIKYNLANHNIVGKWERIYYEEGSQALFQERRGRKNMSFKPIKAKLSKESEEDLIAENQRLRMENAYLKKLQALVQERVKLENLKKHKPSQN